MNQAACRARAGFGQRFWSAIGHQLACPSGTAGMVAGRVMTLANRRPVELTIEALAPRPGEDILELGFGSGLGLAQLAARAGTGRICGVDRSAEMAGQASERNKAAIVSGRMELVQASFSPLKWPDGSFDAILAANVIYFFDHAGADIREAHRVLRPGGRIAVYVTARSTMKNWPFCEPDTHRVFDEADVEALLEQGGFGSDNIHLASHRLPLGIEGIVAVARKADDRI